MEQIIPAGGLAVHGIKTENMNKNKLKGIAIGAVALSVIWLISTHPKESESRTVGTIPTEILPEIREKDPILLLQPGTYHPNLGIDFSWADTAKMTNVMEFLQQGGKNFTGRGYIFLPDGANYIGDWVSGKRHGKGIAKLISGDAYAGDWAHDNIEGKGMYTWVQPRWKDDVYIGQFKNNEQEGDGFYFFNKERSGYFYGKWHNGKQYLGTRVQAGKPVQQGLWDGQKFIGPAPEPVDSVPDLNPSI
jgi:hypothetical protein